MKEKTKRQKAIIRRRIFISSIAVFLAVCVAALCLLVSVIVKSVKSDDNSLGSTSNVKLEQTENSSGENNDPNRVVEVLLWLTRVM